MDPSISTAFELYNALDKWNLKMETLQPLLNFQEMVQA